MGIESKPSTQTQASPGSQLVMTHAVATIAKTVDERILALPGSRDRLLPAIQKAIDFYQAQIASIPGVIPVAARLSGGLEHPAALFPSTDDISNALGRSIAVRNSIGWFVDHGVDRIFAVMGIRRRPGSNSGWTDHTFRSLAATEADTRECLCEAAFTSLINAFANRLRLRQREWRALHPGGSPTGEGLASTGAATTPSKEPTPEQQAIFARHLDPAGPELTAEDGLGALIEWLQIPEAQMHLSTQFTEASVLPVTGDAIYLPMLSSADRRQWLVGMVEFSLKEAQAGIVATPAANRYILV